MKFIKIWFQGLYSDGTGSGVNNYFLLETKFYNFIIGTTDSFLSVYEKFLSKLKVDSVLSFFENRPAARD